MKINALCPVEHRGLVLEIKVFSLRFVLVSYYISECLFHKMLKYCFGAHAGINKRTLPHA